MRVNRGVLAAIAVVACIPFAAAEPTVSPSLAMHLQKLFGFDPPNCASVSHSTRCIRWFDNPTWAAQSWTVATWSESGEIKLVLETTNGAEEVKPEYYQMNLETRQKVTPAEVFAFQVVTDNPQIRQALNMVWSALDRNTYYENEEMWFDSNILYLEAYDARGLQRAFTLYAPKHPYCASDIDEVTAFITAYIRASYRSKFIELYEYWYMRDFPDASPEDLNKARAVYQESVSAEVMLDRLAGAVATMKKNEGSVLNYKPPLAKDKERALKIYRPGEKSVRACPAYYCQQLPEKAS